MALITNKRFRIMDNNHAELTGGQITKSSELSAFPLTNAINRFRSKVWKPSGRFTIDTTNNKLYTSDGTATITAQDYTTPALLATEIQTQLNSVGSNWTVSYSTSTYRFTIANTANKTLTLSSTTNAIWDTIGFTTSSDLLGQSFTADQQRNHTSEEVVFDLGYNADVSFISIIGPLDEIFSISTAATVKLQANNLSDWTSPPLEITLSRTSGGIFKFLDDVADRGYRFWRIYIEDKLNPLGPEGISIGHIYIGDFFTFSSRNIRSGFKKELTDPSRRNISEAGAIYFDKKTKYRTFESMFLDFLPRADKDKLQEMFQKFGRTSPFYISIDPKTEISDNIDEFTAYVIFENEPVFTHIKTDTFSVSMQFREVL